MQRGWEAFCLWAETYTAASACGGQINLRGIGGARSVAKQWSESGTLESP